MIFILFLSFTSLISASATCYFRNGNVAESSYKPCNINVTGTTNSHSACCDTTNSDVCLESGLCFYPGPAQGTSYSFFFADGCTDKNLADASCQTFCPSTLQNVQVVLNCGNGQFCCSDAADNATACCGGKTFPLANAFGMPSNLTASTVVATVTATSGSDSSGGEKNSNNTSVVAVGVVLGVLLAIALATIAFLLWKLRNLRNGLNSGNPRPTGIPAEVYKAENPPGELSGTPEPFELSENRT